MPVTFNPAGSLTANRIPYATGDGRLADSGFAWSFPSSVNTFGSVSGDAEFRANSGRVIVSASAGVGQFPGISLFGTSVNSSNGSIQLNSHSSFANGLAFGTSATGSETIWRHSAGVLRTDGQWQIGATNPTPMQWQAGITALRLGDRCSVDSALVSGLGTVLVRSSSRPTYGLPTGTVTRTTFDPATVTLSQLAERVAAIINDLSSANGTYHGLFA